MAVSMSYLPTGSGGGKLRITEGDMMEDDDKVRPPPQKKRSRTLPLLR